ncbi:MAG TPA: OmpW family outer membrane protein [Gammaproteobacteria bacterium]|nr:OmpW family outer membrane protein [Gammaproteobacteria bacterium]
MSKRFQKRLIPSAIAGALAVGLGLAATTGTAQALQQGDWLVRVGASTVEPNESSSNPTGALPAGSEVSINSNTQLSFTVAYMFTNNISFEILGATPFSHDISGAGTLAGAGKIAEIKHLPPTFSVNWHFQPQARLRPYVGAGINYTYFYDEKTQGLGATDISLDSSWGPAVQAGLDYDINNKWFLNANVRYIKISTTAKLTGAVTGNLDVDVDPMVYTLAVGTHF